MSIIHNICSLLYCVKCCREIASANSSGTEISQAAYKNLIKDDYWLSNMVNYILQILPWQTCLFNIKSRVSILLHIPKSDPLSWKSDICRKLPVGDSLDLVILTPG